MTKGNFSQPPSDELSKAVAKRYVGLHVEQGVPVLDRDLNLLGDMIAATLQQILAHHIGDGTAGMAGTAGAPDLSVKANGTVNDFTISAGSYVVGGLRFTLPTGTSYRTQVVPPGQSKPPDLTTPDATQAVRTDTVYLDVWSEEVDDDPVTGDPDLGNPGDVGIRTSTRTKVQVLVRVAENVSATALPAAPDGHAFCPVASLMRPTGAAVPGSGVPPTNTIVDLRRNGLSLVAMMDRLQSLETIFAPVISNYLPSTAQAGQKITIGGKNLTVGSVKIMIGGSSWIDPDLVPPATDTSISVHVPVTVPAGQTTVVVRNSVGSASGPQLSVQGPVQPAFAAAGSQFDAHSVTAGRSVGLSGTNLLFVDHITFVPNPSVTGLASVTVDKLNITHITDTSISLIVPAALPAGTYLVNVSINAVTPPSQKTSDDTLTVTAAAPS